MQEGTEGVLILVISDDGEGEWRMSPSGSMMPPPAKIRCLGKGKAGLQVASILYE